MGCRKSTAIVALGLLLVGLPLRGQILHGTVEIEYANADGSFRPPVRWALGDHARAVKVADINSDTLPDLLVGYEKIDAQGTFQSYVAWMIGKTDGFDAPVLEWTSGEPMEMVVELFFDDYNGDTHTDFAVWTSLDPAAPGPLTTRHRFIGDGAGNFTFLDSLPGSVPPGILPEYPILAQLDGANGADRISVNRRSEDLSNLPLAAVAAPLNVNAPDVSAVPPGNNFYGTLAIRLVPSIHDPSIDLWYTMDGSAPIPGNMGTFHIAYPFGDLLYVYKTTTLAFVAEQSGLFGPTHQATYTLSQSERVDSDNDGIPDAYEICGPADPCDEGKARPGYDPLRTNLDTDRDGVSDQRELLQDTNPFSLTCRGYGNNGVICDGDEDCGLAGGPTCFGGANDTLGCTADSDCPAGFCSGCFKVCLSGANAGNRCQVAGDCPPDGDCGDASPGNPEGDWVLSGTATNGLPAADLSEVRAFDARGRMASKGAVKVQGGAGAWSNMEGLRQKVRTGGYIPAVPDDTDPEGDVLLTRFVPAFELDPPAVPDTWSDGASWLSEARNSFGQPVTRSGLLLDGASSGLTALVGEQARNLLVETGHPPSDDGLTRFGRLRNGLSDGQLLRLSLVTELGTHAFLLREGAARTELTLLDGYTQFAADLMEVIKNVGMLAVTPSENELADHLRNGTISVDLQADMLAKGYDATTITAIADRARAESAAISAAVEGAILVDIQTAEDAEAGVEMKYLKSVRLRPDVVLATVDQAAGNLAMLAQIEAAGSALAAACLQAVIREGDGGQLRTAGTIWDTSQVTCGSQVIADAIVAAAGDPGMLAALTANMDNLIQRIIGAACDPGQLAALAGAVGDFLVPDTVSPSTTAIPAGGLFVTAMLPVTLQTNEPATLYLTTNGQLPVKGQAGTQVFASGAADLMLASDTVVRFFAEDNDGNTESVQTESYSLDRDADGVADVSDNCLYASNPGQVDTDMDGTGDACDPAECGNGTIEPGETCDDNNQISGDGCSSDCLRQKRVDLSGDAPDFVIQGPAANAMIGEAVATGDLTGDTLPEIVFSAGPLAAEPGIHIVTVARTGPAVRDLLAQPAEVRRIDASSASCGATIVVTDVDGDGSDDLVIGCPDWDRGGNTSVGAVFVFPGPLAPGSANILETDAVASVFGSTTGERLGVSVAVGDRDGDGNPELLCGAPDADVAGNTDAGRAVLFELDPTSFPQTFDMGVTPGATPVIDLLGAAGDRLGHSVSMGDVDGNGRDEIAIGSPGASPGGNSGAGSAYLLPDSATTSPGTFNPSTDPSAVMTYRGAAAGDGAGTRVRLRDVNDDGRADFATSAPFADGASDADVGKVYLDTAAYGQSAGTGLDLTDGVLALTVTGAVAMGGLGGDLRLEDMDGDRRAEIIATQPAHALPPVPAQRKVLVLAPAQSGTLVDLAVDEGSALAVVSSFDTAIPNEPLSTGDLWGDAAIDIIVGNATANPSARSGAGEIHVYAMNEGDADHDGILDTNDPCPGIPLATDPLYTTHADSDADGRGDECDNCPNAFNPNQLDTDNDGAGDLCDPYPAFQPSNPCDGVFDFLNGYPDSDSDGWGDPCDCAPLDAGAFPGAAEVCDGRDSNCDGALLLAEADMDADGFAVCLNDCADDDPARNPGAVELCNGIDDACHGSVPLDEQDVDADGFAACEGDCDDGSPTVYPGRTELCRNSVDDDCDDLADGADPACLAPGCLVITLGDAPGGDPRIMFDAPGACPTGIALARPVDVIWGDLGALTVGGGGQVELGTATQVVCGGSATGVLFDSLRPDAGSGGDFVLVRESGVADYGQDSLGRSRAVQANDCP